jgi:hypothetical protein
MRMLTLEEGETRRLDFSAGGRLVSGRILKNGLPVSGARIALFRDYHGLHGWSRHLATSESDGRYRIEGVQPGIYRVRLFETPDEEDTRLRQYRLAVSEEPVERDFNLSERLLVSGQVLHAETKEPIVEARVQAIRVEKDAHHGGRVPYWVRRDTLSATTDPEGRFELSVQREGLYRLSASHYLSGRQDSPWGAAAVRIEVRAPGVSGVSIQVGQSERIEGRISDPLGQPVTGAYVYAESEAGGDRSESGWQGRFSLHVPAGESLEILTLAAGYAPIILSDVRASEELLDLRLSPGGSIHVQADAGPEQRQTLILRLIDSEGRDLARLFAQKSYMSSWLDSDLRASGSIRFPHLAPGTYTLIVDTENRTVREEVVVEQAATRRVVIDLSGARPE